MRQTIHRAIALTALVLFLCGSLVFAQANDASGGKINLRKVSVQKPDDNKKQVPMEYVKMKTTKGDIIIELDPTNAPITVANFLEYVDSNAYDSTIFHRVINGFMIQGGGFNGDMTKRPTHNPIKNEWGNGLKNLRGTIAMARRGGDINSATNQFFINVKDNFNLDMKQQDGAGYAVFGKVIQGMDVVDAIKVAKTKNMPEEEIMYKGKKQRVPGPANVPVEPIYILDVVRIDKPAGLTE
ncbi:MAG: peptidylprolyl isomerase [Candidatus Zixiibacteriota bacterium]